MKEITLTQDQVALVDDEDYNLLSQFNWHYADGYARTHYINEKGQRRILLMHRLLMGMPKGLVDHINMNGLDNRRLNLRLATASQNMGNSKTHKRGIYYKPQDKRWCAQIQTNGVKRWLGSFKTEQDALAAYQAAAKEYWGEYLYEETI